MSDIVESCACCGGVVAPAALRWTPEDEVRAAFGARHRFAAACDDAAGKAVLRGFLVYAWARFQPTTTAPRRDQLVDALLEWAGRTRPSDADVLLRMRVDLAGDNTPEALGAAEVEAYQNSITTKAADVWMLVRRAPGAGTTDRAHLDVGTEHAGFLDEMQRRLGGRAWGLNLSRDAETGFAHYAGPAGFEALATDPRILLYDGVRVPVERLGGGVESVSVLSVLHHMPPENLASWAVSLGQACHTGALVYVKDVDLRTDAERLAFEFQHLLFEGVVAPGSVSYRNDGLTLKTVVDAMQGGGFELATSPLCKPSFNRTFVALFRRRPAAA